jgi:hypothetical protein
MPFPEPIKMYFDADGKRVCQWTSAGFEQLKQRCLETDELSHVIRDKGEVFAIFHPRPVGESLVSDTSLEKDLVGRFG